VVKRSVLFYAIISVLYQKTRSLKFNLYFYRKLKLLWL